MTFFISGAAIYYYRQIFARYSFVAIVFSAIFVALEFCGWSMEPLFPAALAIVVMAMAFGPYLGNAGRFGDLSYGAYIWHFPIFQILISRSLFASRPWGALFLGSGIALAMAFLSWHLVEKRFLLRSSHYRHVEETP